MVACSLDSLGLRTPWLSLLRDQLPERDTNLMASNLRPAVLGGQRDVPAEQRTKAL